MTARERTPRRRLRTPRFSVLRYDSGRTDRRPFFVDDGGAGVWFAGTRLGREKSPGATPR